MLVYTDPVPDWWAVILDVPDDRGSAMYLEGDEEMRRVADDLEIEWIPEDEYEAKLERDTFDVRSTFLSPDQLASKVRQDNLLRRFTRWSRKAQS